MAGDGKKKGPDGPGGRKKRLRKYVAPALIVYGSIMQLGLEQVAAYSSRTLKTDIEPLSLSECEAMLDKLLRADIYRFRYKQERRGSKRHIGVMAEEAPVEIVDQGRRAIRLASTLGFLMAAVKALAHEQRRLLERLKRA